MLKLLRFETVTSSFQHPRVIKKRNRNCCKIFLRRLIILMRESKGGGKKKKSHTFETLRISLEKKLFPKILFHSHASHTRNQHLQSLLSFRQLKNFTPKKTVQENFPFSQHLENNYISQATFDILPSPGIDSASLHACTRPRIVRFCTCIASGAVATSRARVVPHPPTVLRRGTWETLQCQECGVKVVPFRTRHTVPRLLNVG